MSVSAAIASRDVSLLPSRRQEGWRWTGLRELIREAPPASPPLDLAAIGPSPLLSGLSAPVVLYGNGRLAGGGEASLPWSGRGESVRRFVSRGDGGHAVQTQVAVGPGAALILLDSVEGRGGYLSSIRTRLVLEPGAAVDHLIVLDEPEGAVSVTAYDVALGAGARYRQTVLASGARRQRIETAVAHAGAGAELTLNGVYTLAGRRHADITTAVEHAGPDGASRQLVKGVATGRARGVFQGRITVAKGADGADARLGHHALILSDGAEVDAKPELEIHADDVACAHGNTVGALDPDALFYARGRGIGEVEARAMLTAAFLGEVVDAIGPDALGRVGSAWLGQAMEELR